MDTKSTKNLRRTIIKAILIIASCALFVTTYFFGQQLVQFYIENTDGYLTSLDSMETVLGNGNSTFAKQIRSETGKVRSLASKYVDDEFVESGEAFAKYEAELRDRYQKNTEGRILQEQISFIESNYEYDYEQEIYTYPGFEDSDIDIVPFSSEQQIQADRSFVQLGDYEIHGITIIDGVRYYKGFPVDEANIDKDEISEELTKQMQAELATQKGSFKTDYANLKAELSELTSYKYFLLNKTNGMIYTNIENAETIEEAAAHYPDKDDYRASVVGGEFSISRALRNVLETGQKFISGNYITSENDYYNYCFGTLDMDKYDMFIYVDLTPDGNDVFSGIYKDWKAMSDSVSERLRNTIICFAAWILSLVLLAVFAGNRGEDGKIKETLLDKLPNSIHFVISVMLVMGCAVAPMGIYLEFVNWNFKPSLVVAVITVLSNFFFIEWLMSASRQGKNDTFWKNTIIYKAFIKNWPAFKRWANSGINKITNGEIKKRVFYVFIAYLVVMVAAACIPFVGAGIAVVASIAMFIYVLKLSKGLDAISSALTKAEGGDYDFAVDVDVMPAALQSMGENVNNLTNGLNIAIDEATKSERMKTELITNVSHDLKTPLTSIITYTDLLKQCDIEDATANEYIGVLDEKSHRLKKLVEDLVEASKASSGNVTLNMVKIDVNELTEQIYGEYEDDLTAADLELKINAPENPVYIVADGQKTYRILENLFSNVKKYAMPGSRVYLDIASGNTFASITMKNVAKDEMHFDVERLTDRFVQGEESRTNEGSGLGLSIAKSLTELQGGRFNLSVDGDLFKVTIALPKSKD